LQNALELVALDVKHRRCLCRCLLVRYVCGSLYFVCSCSFNRPSLQSFL